MKRVLLLSLCVALLLGFTALHARSGTVLAAGSTPPPPAGQSLPLPQLDQKLQVALDTAIAQAADKSLGYLVYEVGVHQVLYDLQDGWAAVLLEWRDPQTHEVLPTEPGLGLAYFAAGEWHVVLPSDPLWPNLLPLLPDTLLDTQAKEFWLRRNTPPTANLTAPLAPFGGYLLPWEGQTTNRLTRSIDHGGKELYAFDFAAYTPGDMFAVYAAKGGTVKYVKWNYPNGYYDGNCNHANYIVLEDTTTSPTTYQLYLHLAQNSIPEALRTHGVYVQQGQYLGLADDTGCSTGNHLHFQVHTTLAWWSTAVDITFDDVPINGGRPRTPSEAARTGQQGQTYYTSGNVVHNPDTTPPTGGLLSPFSDGSIVHTRTLTLQGWATDDLSGVQSAQFKANYDGTWVNIGPPRSGLTYSYTWDLCADAVPDGPLSLAVQVQDYAHNTSPPLTGLVQTFKKYDCTPVPQPACQPAANQVALFSTANYGGDCAVLDIGDYAHGIDLGAVGGQNTASVLVGQGVGVTLFGQENFQGRSTSLWVSDPNLADNPIGTGTTQSVRVHPKGASASIPQGQWPLNGASFPQRASLDLLWQDTGGGQAFQTRLSFLTNTLTSTWQAEPFLSLGSLPSGTYTWTVRARNAFTSGISITQWSTPYTFSLQSGSPLSMPLLSLPYSDTMDAPNAAWQAENWVRASDPARRGQAWVVSPTLTSAGQPYAADLTLAPITVTQSGYALRFWYRGNTEGNGTNWDQRWVQIAIDGAPFENFLQLKDDPMLGWLHSPEIDLSSYVGHTVQVRFHFVTLDGQNNPPAPWAIDDLTVAPAEAFACRESTPNDTADSATPLNFGQTVTGSICPPGDLDYFVFQGQAGQKISADVDAVGAGNGSQLDGYLFLLAEDGRSQLAEHDDEVLFEVQDPHLGFTLPYSGTYYLKLRAWDHPTAGGEAYTYTLHLLTDDSPPTVTLQAPTVLHLNQPITLTASASDDDGVRQVSFWWHSGDWEQDAWQLLGTDADGRDGWQMPFDPSALPPQTEIAFYVEARDWAGNHAYAGVWHAVYGYAAYLPLILR